MPVPGPRAKPRSQTVHRNKPTHEWTEVEDVPFTHGPALPAFPKGDDADWHPMTLEWWDDVRTMPHARLWKRSDWRFAFDTALVADVLYSGDVRAATELRNREKVLGTTGDYRRDLRIRYIEPRASRPDDEETPDNVSYLEL